MIRFIRFAAATLTATTLIIAGACSSGDDDDGAGASTATGTATGSGGACGCWSCSDYSIACATECPAGNPRDLVCDASEPTLDALNECICDPARGNCLAECPTTCALTSGQAGAAPDTDQCTSCQGPAIVAPNGTCINEWNSCLADKTVICP